MIISIWSMVILAFSVTAEINTSASAIKQIQLAENHESNIENEVTSPVPAERERRFFKNLFCNSYLQEQKVTCAKTTASAMKMARKKEAGLCKKSIADAVNAAVIMKKNAKKKKETSWCKKNAVIVEKVGPFKARSKNKIGEITKYYHNYEFSMDLKFAETDLQRPYTQLLEGIV